MKIPITRLTVVLVASAVFCVSVVAQPGGGRRGGPPPGRRGGGPGPFEQVVDTLNLSDGKRQAVLADLRTYQDNVRGLTDFASGSVVLRMKEILTPDDFSKFKSSVDATRTAAGGATARPLIADDVVERVMTFDKEKTGNVKIEDLPERMQPQVAMGDLNQDGVVNRDELKNLVSDNPRRGAGRGGGAAPALGGNGGGAGRGGRGGNGAQTPAVTTASLERVVGDLRLSGVAREAANSALRSYQENVRKVTEMARADLLVKVSAVLNPEEYGRFAALLERSPAVLDRPAPRGGQPPGRGGQPPGRGSGRRGGPPVF